MASDILVVDDEEDIRELVSGILSDEGHETRGAGDSDGALQSIASGSRGWCFWTSGCRARALTGSTC